MPRANVTLQNFSAGELSPKLRGRYDIGLYKNGCEKLENFIPETQGPARFRTGTRFVAQTRHNLTAIFYTFIFNDAQSYILEFTAGAIRFFTANAILTETATAISAVTQADPAVVTDNAHGYSNGDEIIVNGVVGMTELNGRTFKLANITANTYELQTPEGVDVDSSGFTAYISGGAPVRIFTLSNPYTESELIQLKTAQSSDTMYIVHRNHAPRKLIRSGPTAWTFATYVRTADPFTGAGDFPGVLNIYDQRMYMGGTDDDPLKFFGSASASFDDFTIGTGDTDAFTFTVASKRSDRINALESNNKFLAILSSGGNKSAQGGNDLAISPTNILIKDIDFIGSDQANPVLKDNLIVFLQQGQRKIRALEFSIEDDGYQPKDLTKIADHITETGITQMAYQEGAPDIIWAIRNDGQLIGATYDPKESVLGWHRHMTGISDKFLTVATIPQDSDFEQLWTCVDRTINGATKFFVEFFENIPIFPEFIDSFSGKLNKSVDRDAFTLALYEKQKDYFHVDCGLTFDGTITTSSITPSAITGADIVFTASGSIFKASDVGRQIWHKAFDGRAEIITFTSATVVRCKILKDFDSTNAILANNWFLTANVISGLDHLENEIVEVVTDGSVHPTQLIVGGSITLNYQASIVHIGIPYTGLIVTHNIEGGGAAGPAQTKVRNIFKLGIRFLNTLGAEFGTDQYKLEKILFRTTSSFTNRPPELFSGDKVLTVRDSWKREKRVIIRQDSPLPCTVQLLVPYLNTSEE